MERQEIEKYLGKGVEIAGGATGAAIGLIGGPWGAVIGGGLGNALIILIKDIIHRKLSNRQEIRVAASTAYIITGICERLTQGQTIRHDIFDESGTRSSAEELFEAVLLKCKDEYQEKKIFYISKIFEKVLFDSDISSETANQIVLTVENLTYRQFCAISFFGQKENFDESLLMKIPLRWYRDATFSMQSSVFIQEISQLLTLNIIDFNTPKTDRAIIPFSLQLTTFGRIVFTVMDLVNIPISDIIPIYEEFKYKSEYGLTDEEKSR